MRLPEPKTASLFQANHKPLPPPFGWVGGKSRLSKQIVALIPEHRVYVEPFAGAASVFWQKPPSEVEVLNDIDSDLMRFYRGLHTLEGCDLPKEANDWAILLSQDGQLQPCQLVAEAACSFGSIRESKAISGSALKQCQSNAPKFHHNLPAYRERIKGVILLNGDWQDVVERYDSPDAFFYLDPPYHGTSRNYHFSDDQLAGLAEVLPNLKGKWILSYDDHADVHQAFSSFQIRKVQSLYTISAGDHVAGKQLLIANFPLRSTGRASIMSSPEYEADPLLDEISRQICAMDQREHGFTICSRGCELLRGPESVGHKHGVTVDISCPEGAEPIGTYHSHPSDPTLSEQDEAEMVRLGLPVACVGVPDSGVKCYLISRCG